MCVGVRGGECGCVCWVGEEEVRVAGCISVPFSVVQAAEFNYDN